VDVDARGGGLAIVPRRQCHLLLKNCCSVLRNGSINLGLAAWSRHKIVILPQPTANLTLLVVVVGGFVEVFGLLVRVNLTAGVPHEALVGIGGLVGQGFTFVH